MVRCKEQRKSRADACVYPQGYPNIREDLDFLR